MLQFSFLFVLAAFSALFAEDFPLEKVSSKARTETKLALTELNKNTVQSIALAIKLLEVVTQDQSFRRLDIESKMQTLWLLSSAYQKAKCYQPQDALIAKLLSDSSFSRFWIELKVHIAKSWLTQSRIDEAGKIYNQLLREPKRRVSHHESEEIIALGKAIERYLEEQLVVANRLYAEKRYLEAAAHFSTLHKAFDEKLFPQSRSIQSCQEFIAPLRYRLACCYYLSNDNASCIRMLSLQNRQFLESHKTLFPLYLQSLKLQAASCTQEGHFKEAAECLQQYLKLSGEDPKVQAEQAYLECLSLFFSPEKKELFFSSCELNAKKFPDKQHAFIYLQGLKRWQQKEYAEADALFSPLIGAAPLFEKRAELLFYTARSREVQKKEAKQLYQELYLNHPDSWCAPGSYFRCYPEKEYIQGTAEAILHLKRMPKEWENTPFGILASFYIAENIRLECPQKNVTDTHIKLLQEAEGLFLSLIPKTKQLPAKLKIKFERMALWAELDVLRVQFLLASHGGKNITAIVATANALQNFKSSLEEKMKKPKAVERSTLYTLWQECAWQRYRTLMLQGETRQAFEELKNLLEYATLWDHLKSEAVCFAFCELASEHIRNKEFTEARTLLNQAEAISLTCDKRELLLRVWLTESSLEKKQQRYDAAMALLSRVINDMSVSSLRVQAMYQRAELYERKGRRDLAMRQLEACSKKGGEWAGEAKKKLEVFYGYE